MRYLQHCQNNPAKYCNDIHLKLAVANTVMHDRLIVWECGGDGGREGGGGAGRVFDLRSLGRDYNSRSKNKLHNQKLQSVKFMLVRSIPLFIFKSLTRTLFA